MGGGEISLIDKGYLFKGWKSNAVISELGAQGLVRVEISGNTASEVQRIGMQRIGMGKRIRCEANADGALWVFKDGAGGRLIKVSFFGAHM